MLHAQCEQCGAWATAEPGHDLDNAVRCKSPEGDPPGSPDGLCCTEHASHDEHVAHVKENGTAHCRPLTITVLPGTVTMQPANGG